MYSVVGPILLVLSHLAFNYTTPCFPPNRAFHLFACISLSSHPSLSCVCNVCVAAAKRERERKRSHPTPNEERERNNSVPIIFYSQISFSQDLLKLLQGKRFSGRWEKKGTVVCTVLHWVHFEKAAVLGLGRVHKGKSVGRKGGYLG